MPAIAVFLLACALPCGDELTLRSIEPGVLPESDRPLEIEFTLDGARALTLNELSGNLTIYDVAARETKWALAVGAGPSDMELTPDGARAIVALEPTAQLAVVDLTRHVVASHLTTGAEPLAVRVSPDSALAYTYCAGSGSIVVTSLATGQVLETVSVFAPVAEGFRDLELNTDGTRLAVWGWQGLQSFDTATWATWVTAAVDVRATRSTTDGLRWIVRNTSLASKPVIQRLDATTGAGESWSLPGDESTSIGDWMSVDADGRYVYVETRETIQRLDLTTGEVIETEPQIFVYAQALTPAGDALVLSGYTEESGGVLQVLDPGTLATVRELSGFERGGIDLEFQPGGNDGVVLLGWFGDNLLHFREAGAASEIVNVTSSGVGVEGDQPGHLAIHPNGIDAILSNVASNNLARIDLVTGRVVGHVDVGGRHPFTVRYGPDGSSALLVTNHELDGSSVLVLDGASGAVQAEVAVPSYDAEPLFLDGGERAVVVSPDDATPFGDAHAIFLEVAGADTRVLRRIRVPGNSFGDVAAVTTASGWIVVTQASTRWVSVLCPERMALDHQISLEGSVAFAARPGTDQVAVAMGEEPLRILEIGDDGSQVVGALPLWVSSAALAYSPDGQWLYASGRLPHSDVQALARFDALSGELMETVPFEENLTHWVLSDAGDRLFQVLRQYDGLKETRLWTVALMPEIAEPLDVLLPYRVDGLDTSPSGDTVLASHGSLDLVTQLRVGD